MCGIAGFWGPPDRALLEAMTVSLRHRGPDDDGHFEDATASLGFRRLSIIDLEHGSQPMSMDDGRLQIVYNGEVYNFRELRAELEGARAHLPHHLRHRGGAACLRGMGHRLLPPLQRHVGARDPRRARGHAASWCSRATTSASSRSSTRVTVVASCSRPRSRRSCRTTPSRARSTSSRCTNTCASVSSTTTTGRSSAGSARCPPPRSRSSRASTISESVYWTPRLSEDGDASPEAFRAVFERAVQRRLVADVPVGICLSGGLDSSSICTVMAQQLRDHVPDTESLGDRLKTFSAVFPGDRIDESTYIDSVLKVTGADNSRCSPPTRTSSASSRRGSGTWRSRWCRRRRSPCGW